MLIKHNCPQFLSGKNNKQRFDRVPFSPYILFTFTHLFIHFAISIFSIVQSRMCYYFSLWPVIAGELNKKKQKKKQFISLASVHVSANPVC